ncbi:Trm112 family protein [Ningiella sp. W23]|uniref:Trm112 family protein n=1 Tax=Ningiella sp. W23 TaxID=3023715 RepID=UPI003757229A
MMFNKKLLDIVACPLCKGKLVLHEGDFDEQNARLNEEDKLAPERIWLVCRFDRLAYPIHQGIPVLLESESKLLSSEELEKVKKHD